MIKVTEQRHKAGDYTMTTATDEWHVVRVGTAGGRARWRAQRIADGWIWDLGAETLEDIKGMLRSGHTGHRWRKST